MTIVNRERYYCSAKRERGTCTSSASTKAVALEARVLTGLKDILIGNQDLVDAFVSEFKAEMNRLQRERGSRDRQLQKDLNRVTASIKRCLAFITGGDGDPGLVRDELRVLEAKKHQFEKVLSNLDVEHSIEAHPNMAELYSRKVNALQTLLTDNTTRPEAMEIIRSMIDRIEVHDSGRRGDPDVMLVGALASIVDYTHKNQTAASRGDGGRVLMVAGARSHLYRTKPKIK